MKPPLHLRIQQTLRLSLLTLLALHQHPATADQVLALTPVADTSLRNGTAADSNFGLAPALPAGVSAVGGVINHLLLKFSPEVIPGNATITQVSLNLTTVQGTQPALSHQLFRVLRVWEETNSTWNVRLAPATTWGAPGAAAGTDYASISSATANIAPPPGGATFSSAGLLADVQLWRTNPGTNFGWILIATAEQPGSGKQISSREDPVTPPILTISYTQPAPPVIVNPTLAAHQLRFSFQATSNQAYLVEFRNSLTTGNWSSIQNIPSSPTNAVVTITNNITGDEGYFRLRLPPGL